MGSVGFHLARFVLLLAAFASLASQGLAGEPNEATVRLTVQPMAATKPALKYILLPEVGEMNSGNAAQWYLRCFAEQRAFFFGKEATEERKRLLTMPLGELTAANKSSYGGNAIRQADWAARLNTVDWQVIQRIQSDGLELMQPELGPLFILATAIQVRFRLEIAERHFDDAIRTAKTMFAFARHLGENPTEPANQLGLSVADLALDRLEEMLQQPGCPNLYWALTDLRCPLVELRNGFQGSGTLVANELKTIRDDTNMPDEEIEKAIGRLSGLLGFAREQAGNPPRNFRGTLASRAKDAEKMRALRTRLIASGVAEGLVPSFPPLQAILIDAKLEYETRRDERLKLLPLAPWQIDAPNEPERSAGDGMLSDLLPAVRKLRLAQARFEQRIALLRHVEALRMFAAAHAGKWPEKLTELTVPLPLDAFTGKPFAYEAKEATATLHGGCLRGEEKSVAYEIRLKPAANNP